MGSLSIWHWLIVLAIVVLVFGTGKLKNMGKDLGGAIKGFKEGMNDATDDKKPAADAKAAVASDAAKPAAAKEEKAPRRKEAGLILSESLRHAPRPHWTGVIPLCQRLVRHLCLISVSVNS